MLTISGGIEVARTPERMEELRPADVVGRLVGRAGLRADRPRPRRRARPLREQGRDPRRLLHARGQRRRLAARRHADARVRARSTAGSSPPRAPRSPASTSSTAASRRVHTDKGSVECETLFIACGVWSPRIARMAGATIPLTPAVHQMISVGPIPLFAETKGEIEYPIIRDVDTNCYERQNGSDMEVGSYAHRAILMSPDDIPSIEESALSPTELPFTVRGLRPADGAGARADAGDPHRRGRRDPARDQRAAVADARRDAAARRDRGQGRLVGGGASGSRRQPGSPARSPSGRPTATRRSTCTARTSRASTPTSARAGTSTRARTRATTAPTGSSTRWSSGSRTARFG